MLRQSLGVAIDMVRLLEGPRTLSGVRREVVSSNQGLLLRAKHNAPACEECLFPLRVSSEDASASARLSSRRLDECSRCPVSAYTSSQMCCLSASQCTFPWTTVQMRESEKDWLHSGLLPGRPGMAKLLKSGGSARNSQFHRFGCKELQENAQTMFSPIGKAVSNSARGRASRHQTPLLPLSPPAPPPRITPLQREFLPFLVFFT